MQDMKYSPLYQAIDNATCVEVAFRTFLHLSYGLRFGLRARFTRRLGGCFEYALIWQHYIRHLARW